MEIVNSQAENYAEKYTSAEDKLLHEIAEITKDNHPKHHMLSGHLQGKLLETLSCMLRPKRILEIGTFTGYSTLCLAKGLANDGMIHTIELREKDAQLAKNYFDRSAYSEKITLHIGNAMSIISAIEEEWDLVFIDADKVSYIDYFNLVLPRVKKNGFIFADNVFFHGQVFDSTQNGKSVKAIRAFNEYINNRRDVEKMMLTIRDGMYLIRKL